MACVQKISSRAGIDLFGDVLKIFMGIINEAFEGAQTVHIASDKYDTLHSVKAGEKKRRGSFISASQIRACSSNQVLPKNMKNYLENPQNIDNLNDFIFTELEKRIPARLDTHQTLVISGGFQNHERVVAISNGGSHELDEIFSTQGEANTRLILHIKDSIYRYWTTSAVRKSPNTDVMILGVYFAPVFSIETGIKNKVRCISLHKTAEKLQPELTL